MGKMKGYTLCLSAATEYKVQLGGKLTKPARTPKSYNNMLIPGFLGALLMYVAIQEEQVKV